MHFRLSPSCSRWGSSSTRSARPLGLWVHAVPMWWSSCWMGLAAVIRESQVRDRRDAVLTGALDWLIPGGKFKQSSITDHIASTTGGKTESRRGEASTSYSCSASSVDPAVTAAICSKSKPQQTQTLFENSRGGFDRTDRVSAVVQKHFGFSCVNWFQKEALDAWFAHKDCLVLAATGSGSLLFVMFF
jgi:hypothetical protein